MSNRSEGKKFPEINTEHLLKIETTEIENYLSKMIETHEIPGMALCVIKDGKLIHETYKGKASLETGEKVDTNTLFRIYSTTKLISAVSIFKLIEQGEIKLNDPISKYIIDLPKKWNHIEIHHLLAHSSGLPDVMNFDLALSDQDMLNRIFKEKIEFEAGEKFTYNQTNYWFLTKIIETVSNLNFEDFVIKHQFENDKNSIIFSSNCTDIIERKANLYWYQQDKKVYEQVKIDFGKRANSATGLILTLQEFIKWNKRIDKNSILNEKTKQMMWTPYRFENSEDEFLYGWGKYPNNSVGFTGSGVTGYRKFLDDNLTIIFLSNGFKKQEPVHNEIIDEVARIVLGN